MNHADFNALIDGAAWYVDRFREYADHPDYFHDHKAILFGNRDYMVTVDSTLQVVFVGEECYPIEDVFPDWQTQNLGVLLGYSHKGIRDLSRYRGQEWLEERKETEKNWRRTMAELICEWHVEHAEDNTRVLRGSVTARGTQTMYAMAEVVVRTMACSEEFQEVISLEEFDERMLEEGNFETTIDCELGTLYMTFSDNEDETIHTVAYLNVKADDDGEEVTD